MGGGNCAPTALKEPHCAPQRCGFGVVWGLGSAIVWGLGGGAVGRWGFGVGGLHGAVGVHGMMDPMGLCSLWAVFPTGQYSL